MNYVYCPNCNQIHEAHLTSSLFDYLLKAEETVVCAYCGKKVKQNLSRKSCTICGNVLFYPSGMSDVQLPCNAQHMREAREKELIDAKLEAEDRATQLSEKTAELEKQLSEKQRLDDEDQHFRLLLEIPCESCPGQMLRIKKGRFPACPNCGNEPRPKYVQDYWKRLTGKTPQPLVWDDRSGELLVHEHQNSVITPPFSVLVVSSDQIVVFDNDGNRTPYTNGVYPVFRDTQSMEEKIYALNTLEDEGVLSLGLHTRITFFRREFTITDTINFEFDRNHWTVSIPFSLHVKIDDEGASKLIPIFRSRKEDIELTTTLKDLIIRQVSRTIGRLLLHSDESESTIEIISKNDLRRWLIRTLSDQNLVQITGDLNHKLIAQYGLTIPHPIEIEDDQIIATNTNETVDIACPAMTAQGYMCNYLNHISKNDLLQHKAFVCKRCGKTITWCPSCRTYVTTERIPKVCDPLGHRIYQ